MNPIDSRRQRPAALRWLLLTLLSSPLIGVAMKASQPQGETQVLPAMRVKGELKCSFGLAFAVIREPTSRRVVRLVVTDVYEPSSAANVGLKPGDEILALNDEKVSGMTGGFKRGERLFDLLINRPAGEKLFAEIKEHSSGRTRSVLLRSATRAFWEEAAPRMSGR